MFLKYLDGLEQDKAMEAELEGRTYSFILDEPYRWESWAAPKAADGKLDHNKALTGDDLRDFVDGKLFPYLHRFKQRASGPNTLEYKIGEIFGEIKNKIHSGYNLREIIDYIDELRFRSQTELPILVPSLAQQQFHMKKIYALRGETQRLESIYQQKIAALDELKKSLLHQAFSGKL